MKCNHSLPNNLDGNVSSRECLLRSNHKGNHLIRSNYGNYFLWYPLDECFCNRVPCECFTFKNITKDEAQKLLK